MYMNAFPYYLMVLSYMSLILPFIFMMFRCISKYILYPNVELQSISMIVQSISMIVQSISMVPWWYYMYFNAI
jgi:hypothetical protein